MRRSLPLLVVVAVLAALVTPATQAQQSTPAVKGNYWSCPPCGCSGDTLKMAVPGDCSVCGMSLVKAGSQRKVAVLLYENVELLDFTGPFEVFSAAMGLYEVYSVSKDEHPVRTGMGTLSMIPNYTFENCPTPDIFVIPGGAAQNVTRDSLAMVFVKTMSEHADIVMSVCSGSFILARAGLLDGLTATAHHEDLEDLRRIATKTKVVSARYVDNGKFITAGGVSSGIDGALHVIERMHGKERADDIAYYLQHARRLP